MYLWLGVSQCFRDILEVRVMAQNPTHDLEKPFKKKDVCKAAENLLRRDCFDTKCLTLYSDNASDSTSNLSDLSDEDAINVHCIVY